MDGSRLLSLKVTKFGSIEKCYRNENINTMLSSVASRGTLSGTALCQKIAYLIGRDTEIMMGIRQLSI